MNFGWVDVEEGAGSTTNTCLISSILYKFSLFMLLEDILSIVLPNCPSTALAKMNFGWSILDSYLSIRFSSPFPFSFLFKNLPDWTLNGKIVDSFFCAAFLPHSFLYWVLLLGYISGTKNTIAKDSTTPEMVFGNLPLLAECSREGPAQWLIP